MSGRAASVCVLLLTLLQASHWTGAAAEKHSTHESEHKSHRGHSESLTDMGIELESLHAANRKQRESEDAVAGELGSGGAEAEAEALAEADAMAAVVEAVEADVAQAKAAAEVVKELMTEAPIVAMLSAPTRYKDKTFANEIEKALEKEFPDGAGDVEGSAGRSFNTSLTAGSAALETVARVTRGGHRLDADGNVTKQVYKVGTADHLLATLEDTATQIDKALGMSRSPDTEPEDVARLIDAEDNEFVISNPKNGAMELQQDLQFIADIVVMIVASAAGGLLFAAMGQPVITGYLLAGSLVGPGGFGLINELVQVETLAQFGVVFLLFCLGAEFSVAKLRHVGGVAVLGGLIQVMLLMFVCGTLAKLGGGPISEGVFIGSFLSMSSTAVVLKCLQDRNWMQLLHGQVIIGTLILQDCIVGLLFALLPVLGGAGSSDPNHDHMLAGVFAILRELMVLGFFLASCYAVTRTALPRLLAYVASLSTQSEELYQMMLVAFCLAVAWVSDYFGLSIELGAFVAGVMVSATDYAERTIHQLEPIRNLFAALFLASIGLIMNPIFLWTHMDVLFASVLVVIVTKATLTTVVVRAFGYTPKVAFTSAICLAQVGEFAFVLLSRASNLGLVQRKLYLLLLGTTALSIVTTPLLFRSIPYLIRLFTLMRWLPREDDDALPVRRGASPGVDIDGGAAAVFHKRSDEKTQTRERRGGHAADS